MRHHPTSLFLTIAACTAATLGTLACGTAVDARQAGRARVAGRTLDEWWELRRDADDGTAREARTAMRTLGPAAVPFLAEKAASRDMGDVIGSSSALESLCPGALPAMRRARGTYPSPALDAAIRLVEAEAPARVRAGVCTPGGEVPRPDSGATAQR